MMRPVADIQGCRRAHLRQQAMIADLDDDMMRVRSSLDGWTVGHVLSHLARNAEAMVRRIEATRQGEQTEQYVGGLAGRQRAIDAGAGRPASALIDDVTTWSARVDDVFASLPDDAWELPVRTVGGSSHSVAHLPYRRWREVEIHLVDLDLGAEPADWPDAFVERTVPNLLDDLQRRADHRALMAWILGRGDPPALGPWG